MYSLLQSTAKNRLFSSLLSRWRGGLVFPNAASDSEAPHGRIGPISES